MARHLVFWQKSTTSLAPRTCRMAAVLAEGDTQMATCAREPEVIDLAALHSAMGAQISGAGTATIRVQGVTSLHGARYRINPDRIEAGTFLIAGAITGGDLIVANCNTSHLGAVMAKLQRPARALTFSAPTDPQSAKPPNCAPPTSQPKNTRRFSHRYAGAIYGPGNAG